MTNDQTVTQAEENARGRGMDYAATFCIDALANMLGVEEYRICDGTEEWEGDVRGTLWNILVAADVIDEEDGAISRHRTAHSGEGRSNGAGDAREAMLQTARDLRENANGDCSAIEQAIAWERRAAALSAPQGQVERSTAIEDIAAERRRQVEREGWAPEHDDEHGGGELAKAAAAYALHGRWFGHLRLAAFDPTGDRGQRDGQRDLQLPPQMWPWEWRWWKPRSFRENLVRAGALIVAEIERIDRAALAQPEAGGE